MKNDRKKIDFHDNPSKLEEKNKLESTRYTSKAANSHMTEQLIIPPARVWDKIEKILDEQDQRRKTGNEILTSSFDPDVKRNRRKVLLASLAGLGLAAGFIWKTM